MLVQLYSSPKGRCSRQFYWLFGVAPFAAVALVVGLLADPWQAGISALAGLTIFFALPMLMEQFKRWHDIGRSGWWILLNFIPYVAVIVPVVIGFIPGTVGPNDYGADPLRIDKPVPVASN